MLTLEVELLTGAYRASLLDGSAAEWPPHPERVFSALVQAWGDGGREDSERAALEWLERLSPPSIEANPAIGTERTAPTVFVPPNDAKGGDAGTLPDRRGRQARTFRVISPPDPVVRFAWSESASPDVLRALGALAARTAALGHSASLARFAFHDAAAALDPDKVWTPAPDGDQAVRAPHAGRFEELERWFARGERPRSRSPIRYRSPGPAHQIETVRSLFGGAPDWFVFEGVGGPAPDLLGFAHVARRVRDALMAVGPQPPSELVSGHAPDDRPSDKAHLAIVPIANVGWEHSTGELLGFALVVPRATPADERGAFLRALAGFVKYDGDVARGRLQLTGTWEWHVERSASPSRASARPERWCGRSRAWASATPILLDRFPEDGDPAEEARLVAAACRHIGLPAPSEIEIHKHSALKGAPPVLRRARGNAAGWTFPHGSKLANRPRRHVVLRFDETVEGPVLLGAGRYHGFGLLLPIEETHGHAQAQR